MKMIGKKTHGNSTETGCCEESFIPNFKKSKAHQRLHKREKRRYRSKEKAEWKRDL